jgi:hypothetical protein
MTTQKINFFEKAFQGKLIEFGAKNLPGKICLSPFVSISVGTNGQVQLCNCSAWMPSTVGNLFVQSLPDILSNHSSTEIRASINDSTYRFCNEKNCGIIQSQQFNDINNVPERIKPLLSDEKKWIMPSEIIVAGDVTCNLSCPSCRTKTIKINKHQKERQIKLGNILYDNLFAQPSNQHMRLHVSTSGEIFASEMLMSFVNRISVSDFPNLQLCIQTNGLLAPKNWHRLNAMQNRVSQFTVTTDAATKSTYETLRRGGRWEQLQKALAWIKDKKNDIGFDFYMRMVVQHQNYQEMELFYQQCLDWGCDRVEFSRITDWGTYAPGGFQTVDVYDPHHPEYSAAQKIYQSLKNSPKTFFYNGFA